jgi:hypothetical protein
MAIYIYCFAAENTKKNVDMSIDWIYTPFHEAWLREKAKGQVAVGLGAGNAHAATGPGRPKGRFGPFQIRPQRHPRKTGPPWHNGEMKAGP